MLPNAHGGLHVRATQVGLYVSPHYSEVKNRNLEKNSVRCQKRAQRKLINCQIPERPLYGL